MLAIESTLLLLQTIPGIPPTLVSGDNAKPIIEVTKNIWLACGFLFSLFVVVGIWMSQYKMIAEKTGGPGQYLNRAITVGITLAGYKVLFAVIMWTCAFAAYKIYPSATADAWIPAGGSLTKYVIPSAPTPVPSPGPANQPTPTPTPHVIGKNTSVVEVIMWGLSNAYGMSFQALPAMIVIMLCNLFFILAVFLISAFWLVFALILYALGPFMITAGLIPGYGDKIWGHWIGATIQCGLWQVWMAFCGMLITSPMLTQLSHLNPQTRMTATSGGGDLSGALMDVQQAAYSVTFLILYLATPLVVNYIFPMGTGGSMGGFMMGGATRMVGKGVRLAGAIKSGGMSEAAKGAASAGIKQTTSRTEGAMSGGVGAKSSSAGGGAKSAQSGGQSSSSGSKSTGNGANQGSYDGAERENQYRVAPNESSYSGATSGSAKTGGSGYGTSQSPSTGTNSQSDNSPVSINNSDGYRGSSSNSSDVSQNAGSQSGYSNNQSSSNAPTSSVGSTSSQSGGDSDKPVYKESSTRPPDIKFGKLPEGENNAPERNAPKNNTTSQNNNGENV